MSHEFESGFFGSRQPAWHGLGTVLEGQLTSQEAIQAAGLTWEVEKEEMFIRGEMNPETGKAHPRRVPDRVALIRSSDKTILGTASEGYGLVQPSEAFSFMDHLLGQEIRYETAGSLLNGKLIWLLAAPSEPVCIAGDKYKTYAFLTAGMDGTRAIKVSECDTRIVCWNTVQAAWGEGTTLSFKHTSQVKEQMAQAARTYHLLQEGRKSLVQQAEALLKLSVSTPKFEALIEHLVPLDSEATARTIRSTGERRSLFQVAWNQEDLANIKNTAWGTLQAVSDVACHGTPQRKQAGWEERRLLRVVGGDLVNQAYSFLTN